MELIYARWLAACTRLAFATVLVTFFVYLFGLLEPLIALERLPALWGLSAQHFVAAAPAPLGWQWLKVVGTGDYANLIGVALLGSVTLAAYLRVLPLLLRHERALAVMAALQIVVLALAASGLLTAGH